MEKSISELIATEIIKLQGSIIFFEDSEQLFREEFENINITNFNKIVFNGSYINLRKKIFASDKNLEKKWLIYISGVNFEYKSISELEYYSCVYNPSIKDILERYYYIDFTSFNNLTINNKLQLLKNIWDVVPEENIRLLTDAKLNEIVMTDGFGYANLDKEYTILKYIVNPKYYSGILERACLEDQFEKFISEEYGLDISGKKDCDEIAEYIILALFQSELIHRSEDKEINPFDIAVSNKNKYVNCYYLLQLWSNHDSYKGKFIVYSKLISDKYLEVIINTLKVQEILSLEFFYSIEDLLYKKLQNEISKGVSNNIVEKREMLDLLNNEYIKELSDKYLEDESNFEMLCLNINDFKAFVDVRKRYYFSKNYLYNNWNILSDILNIMSLLIKTSEVIRNKFDNLNNIISIYEKQECWKIDNYYRTIQEKIYKFDILQSKLFNKVNNIYKYQYLKSINEEFITLIENKSVNTLGVKQQNYFWNEYISNNKDQSKQIVILYIDALRYEIARQLLTTIDGDYNKKISSMIATLPSVTEFGMASMLPNGGNQLNVESYNLESINISDGTYKLPLNNKNDRLRYFEQQASVSGFTGNLGTIIDNTQEELNVLFRNKKRILIYSTELDEMGHMEDDCIQVFPILIEKIKLVIDRLMQLGIEKIVLTADHGFLLTNSLEEWQKVDIPKEANVIVKKRRYFISSNRVEGNYITKQGYELNLNSSLYFNFPIGTNVFKSPGGNKFLHGGITIQELLVPVIELTKNQKISLNDKEQIDVDVTQLSLDFYEVERKEIVHKSIREEMQEYISEKTLSKKESKILELFLKGTTYKDSEIVELCSRKNIRFLSESVMTFMSKFMSRLESEGKNWIRFRVVGNSVYEYFLVEED